MALVLASASPQRRKLLRTLGLRFVIRPSRIPEDSSFKDPRRIAADLARQKARAVAQGRPKDLVIGSDTLVVCRGEILLKPRDRADALRILGTLNGRRHRVHSGIALCRDGKMLSAVVTSKVRSRRLDPATLAKLAGKHMDKSGAYAVQDHEDPFIETVDGPLDNVIGFPREAFIALLKKFDEALAGKALLELRSHPLNFR